MTKTHIYGLRPHDVYTVSVGDETYQLTEATLAAMSEEMTGGAEPCDLEPLMAELEQVRGEAFSAEEKMGFAREMLRRDIVAYDRSEAVNRVTLEGIDTWLDAETRNHLVTSIATWSETHEDYTLDLRDAGKALTLPCNTLLAWLGQIENYAVACYNTTSAHLRAVEKAESVEELAGYDYKGGYPERVRVEIENQTNQTN